VIGAERKHLFLVTVVEERVGVLNIGRLAGGEDQAQLSAVDVRDTPRLCAPGRDDLLERLDCLLDLHVRRLVHQIQLDGVHTQPFQACLDLAEHTIAGEAVVGALSHRVERLRGQARTAACRLDPAADVTLATAATVGVGGVEPAQTELPRSVH
jgi:hypothetical protein